MRFLFALLLSFALPVMAQDHQTLYESAGWPQQRDHFSQALKAAQQRYSSTLPPAVYQTLVDNSNRRFNPANMDRRALHSLRLDLPDPRPALSFFQSPLGRKVVTAEVEATRPANISRYANGLPPVEASATRRLQIRHLANSLPAKEAGAEVSLALAGVAADSLSQMLPGLLGGNQAQGLIDAQRQRLISQMDQDVDNTLLFVYRNLSDAELEQFVEFAQSVSGQAYYKAALSALRSGLAVGLSSADLESPTQGL